MGGGFASIAGGPGTGRARGGLRRGLAARSGTRSAAAGSAASWGLLCSTGGGGAPAGSQETGRSDVLTGLRGFLKCYNRLLRNTLKIAGGRVITGL